MTTMLPIAQIVTTAGTQVRSMLDLATVDDYAAAMEAGAEFPPVIVFHDGNRYYLADGFHRTMAAGRIGATEISADVRTGDAKAALWFAIGANAKNGMRLSGTDKVLAITKALRDFPEKGERELAEHVGCSKTYIHKIKDQLVTGDQFTPPERTIGKDGKSRPATRPKPATEDPRLAPWNGARLESEGYSKSRATRIASYLRKVTTARGESLRQMNADWAIEQLWKLDTRPMPAAVLGLIEVLKPLGRDEYRHRDPAPAAPPAAPPKRTSKVQTILVGTIPGRRDYAVAFPRNDGPGGANLFILKGTEFEFFGRPVNLKAVPTIARLAMKSDAIVWTEYPYDDDGRDWHLFNIGLANGVEGTP